MTQKPAPSAWVVSPTFDLLFLANAAWPLLFLPGIATAGGTTIDFWQIYYLTLPHRWITLVLVAADADRRTSRARTLVGVAVLAAVFVVGAYLGSGAFLCLAVVDFVWNAWHFASQHAGVLRIYSKKLGTGWPGLERWGLRAFVTYSALRAASWATGGLDPSGDLSAAVQISDHLILLVPVLLIGQTVAHFSTAAVGKLAYLTSVCGVYTGFLMSLHYGWGPGVVVFAAAAAMMHAVEYLAVVTHYAWRRQSSGSAGAFRLLARRWLGFLALYVLLLGSLGAWLSRPDQEYAWVWQGLNLWAAFVHYAFDGLIWKLRNPQTAAALGVTES